MQQLKAIQQEIPIELLRLGKNPREYFDPVEMAELEASIRESGVMQPILVRPIGNIGEFEIVAGERRYRAAKAVGLATIPALVKVMSDVEAWAAAIIENDQRQNPSHAEQAKAIKQLLYANNGDKEETARQLGVTVDRINRRLALTACTDKVLKALILRQIQLGHAELLSGVPQVTQDTVLDGILQHKVPVSVLRAQLGKFARKLSDAIFDTAQCNGCPHNSAMQAALFDASIGEGYCQHPSHYDELTMAVIEAKALALKEEYQTIKIIRPQDGFEPLHLSADGDLGVGDGQYQSCKGCEHYGCTVSAMPGAYGQVTASLCFDVACHTRKVAARRQAERQLQDENEKTALSCAPAKIQRIAPERSKPSNQTPTRIVEYRIEQWRKWIANALMAQPERNDRVLIALVLAGCGAQLRSSVYIEATSKIVKEEKTTGGTFKAMLEKADGFEMQHIPLLLKAIAASAAFGIDQVNLEILLNYLEIKEEAHFRFDKTFLELFTFTQLESLAEELKLKSALGEKFKSLRAGKKDDFINGLLNIKGVEYRGLVPKCMRYPRKTVLRAMDGAIALPDEKNNTDWMESAAA